MSKRIIEHSFQSMTRDMITAFQLMLIDEVAVKYALTTEIHVYRDQEKHLFSDLLPILAL